MQCSSIEEKWKDIVETPSKIFQKHKVEPVLWILLNKFLWDSNQDITDVYNDHTVIYFKPYKTLTKEQKKIGENNYGTDDGHTNGHHINTDMRSGSLEKKEWIMRPIQYG